MDGTETELSVVVLLLSSEYSDRRSETLSSPCSCVSCVKDSDNVRTNAGVDGRSSAAVILGASGVGASIVGASVVVQVGNTGGTGTTSSEAGNVAFAFELFLLHE